MVRKASSAQKTNPLCLWSNRRALCGFPSPCMSGVWISSVSWYRLSAFSGPTTPHLHVVSSQACWNLRSKRDYLREEDELYLNLNYQLHTTFQAAYLIQRIECAPEGKHSLPKAACSLLTNPALFLRLLTSQSDFKKVSSFARLELLWRSLGNPKSNTGSP